MLRVMPRAGRGLTSLVRFEVEIGGEKLHNVVPLRLESMIKQKPPRGRYYHVITEPIELLKENGERSGFFLVTARHKPRVR